MSIFVDDTWQEDSIFTAKTANMIGLLIAGTMPPTFPWQDGTSIPAERIPCHPGNRY